MFLFCLLDEMTSLSGTSQNFMFSFCLLDSTALLHKLQFLCFFVDENSLPLLRNNIQKPRLSFFCTYSWSASLGLADVGVVNGRIRDSPRRRDPCLKIRDRDLKALTKSEPETLYCKKTEPETSFCENLSRFPKLFTATHDNELHDIQ